MPDQQVELFIRAQDLLRAGNPRFQTQIDLSAEFKTASPLQVSEAIEIAELAISQENGNGTTPHKAVSRTRASRDPEPPPPPPDEETEIVEEEWVPPIGAAAWHGLAGEAVRAVSPYTEADEVAILLNVLVMFGNIAGPTPHFRIGAARHPGRIFLAMVGDSAAARKGTATREAWNLMQHVDSVWAHKRRMSGIASGEGLIYEVRDPGDEPKKGERDPGAPDKRLLLIEEEMSRVLRVMEREGNTLSDTLRQAWDNGDLQNRSRASRYWSTGAHISCIAHISRYEVRQILSGTNQMNGFANRWVWVAVRRSKVISSWGRGAEQDLQPLATEFRMARDWVSGKLCPGNPEITLAPSAQELWDEVYPRLAPAGSGVFQTLIARGDALVGRLSIIYAMLDRSPLVLREHLEAALSVWRYCVNSVAWIFQKSTGNSNLDKVLAALKEQSPLNRTAISGIFAKNTPKKQIDAALSAGLRLQVLKLEKVSRGRGRPTELWHWNKEPF